MQDNSHAVASSLTAVYRDSNKVGWREGAREGNGEEDKREGKVNLLRYIACDNSNGRYFSRDR